MPQHDHKIIQGPQNFAEKLKTETHRTWILAMVERCSKQPGRFWISSVSLDEFAMASHSCCAPFECFCFLLGEKVTILVQNSIICSFYRVKMQAKFTLEDLLLY